MDSIEDQTGSSTPPAGSASSETATLGAENLPARATAGGRRRTPPPPPPPPGGDDDEEEGMLRMSFLEHLEELRSRIIKMLIGVGVAFVLSLTFASPLWDIISAPAVEALKTLHVNPPELSQI